MLFIVIYLIKYWKRKKKLEDEQLYYAVNIYIYIYIYILYIYIYIYIYIYKYQSMFDQYADHHMGTAVKVLWSLMHNSKICWISY